jgi:hypothetical protein
MRATSQPTEVECGRAWKTTTTIHGPDWRFPRRGGRHPNVPHFRDRLTIPFPNTAPEIGTWIGTFVATILLIRFKKQKVKLAHKKPSKSEANQWGHFHFSQLKHSMPPTAKICSQPQRVH